MHRILVVDDEPSMLRLIRAALGRGDHAIDTAATLDAAIEALATRPALLITDVVLPGGSGYDVAEFAAAAHPGLPILIITGLRSSDPRAHRWRTLLKPFSILEFKNLVLSMLPHD